MTGVDNESKEQNVIRLKQSLKRTALKYGAFCFTDLDRAGDAHYDTISALHVRNPTLIPAEKYQRIKCRCSALLAGSYGSSW